MVIRRVGPMSVAKVCGVLYACIGLLVGVMFSLFSMVLSSFGPDVRPPAFFGALLGVGAIVIAPVFYGVLGFVGGAVTAAIYNVVAGWTGGIAIEVEGQS